MIFSAVYAAPYPYGSREYALRSPVTFAPGTSDAVTSSDALGAVGVSSQTPATRVFSILPEKRSFS